MPRRRSTPPSTNRTLELSRVTATAQRVQRTPSLIARAAADYFLVSIQTEGTGRITQYERTAELRPGDFALYDSTRPYEVRQAGGSTTNCRRLRST